MALLPNGSLANIYESIDAYLQARLIDGAGLSVRLHGIRRFVPPVDAPWIEAHYDFLGLQDAFRRQTGAYRDNALVLATERIGHLQLNIYQRARIWNQRYTTVTARDTVIAAFPDSGIITVADYLTAQATNLALEEVGCIIIDGTTDQVVDAGMQSGVTQHVVQIRTRYLEHFTR